MPAVVSVLLVTLIIAEARVKTPLMCVESYQLGFSMPMRRELTKQKQIVKKIVFEQVTTIKPHIPFARA